MPYQGLHSDCLGSYLARIFCARLRGCQTGYYWRADSGGSCDSSLKTYQLPPRFERSLMFVQYLDWICLIFDLITR